MPDAKDMRSIGLLLRGINFDFRETADVALREAGGGHFAMRKAVAALTFRMPTCELGVKLQKDKAMLARMTPVMFISGGGLPIWRARSSSAPSDQAVRTARGP